MGAQCYWGFLRYQTYPCLFTLWAHPRATPCQSEDVLTQFYGLRRRCRDSEFSQKVFDMYPVAQRLADLWAKPIQSLLVLALPSSLPAPAPPACPDQQLCFPAPPSGWRTWYECEVAFSSSPFLALRTSCRPPHLIPGLAHQLQASLLFRPFPAARLARAAEFREAIKAWVRSFSFTNMSSERLLAQMRKSCPDGADAERVCSSGFATQMLAEHRARGCADLRAVSRAELLADGVPLRCSARRGAQEEGDVAARPPGAFVTWMKKQESQRGEKLTKQEYSEWQSEKAREFRELPPRGEAARD